MLTKQADSKGRITLGDKFANRTVIIQFVDETEVVVTLARIVPEREAWLMDNRDAEKAVREGLAQAQAGAFAQPPDLQADEALAQQLEGEA